MEDPKLTEAFALADPKLKIPTARMLTRDIKDLYKKKKREFIEETSQLEYFAGSNDAGSSSNNKSFVVVNANYVTEDFHLKKKILDVLEMPEAKNAKNYRKRIDETGEKFVIKEKTFVQTTDNEATMKAAFSKEERNGCFAHIESKASKKALDNQKSLKKLRLKLRKIAKKSNKSSKFKYAFRDQQKKRALDERTLKQEVATRFTATHTMIRSFLNDPNEKKDLAMDEEKVEENIKAINEAMKDAKMPKKEIEKLEIKPEDVSKMKKLAPILDALEEGITLLGAEKYATGSAVLPWEKRFNKILEEDEDDPVYISKFKDDLSWEMKTRCDGNLNRTMLAKASFFDKRFDKLKFLEKFEQDEVIKDIKKELEMVEEKAKSEREFTKNNNEESAKKKKRFLGPGSSDSEDEDNMTTVEKELENYRAEPKLRSEGCPFEWWRHR